MATTETTALSYLSPYKPGSPSSTTKGLDSSPTYNQDRTWFNMQATCYISSQVVQHTSEYEKSYYNLSSNEVAEAI